MEELFKNFLVSLSDYLDWVFVIIEYIQDFFRGLAENLSTYLGWLSAILILLWIILIPKSDGRFTTGYRDNAIPPGCFLPLTGIFFGVCSYYLSDVDTLIIYKYMTWVFYAFIICLVIFILFLFFKNRSSIPRNIPDIQTTPPPEVFRPKTSNSSRNRNISFNENKKQLDFEGINDAFSGEPINLKNKIYGCNCGVFYHQSSYEIIKAENNSKCVSCTYKKIRPYNITIKKSNARNHETNLVSIENYKNFENKVVNFEGYIHKVVLSSSVSMYAAMFEKKKPINGFKLVFFGDGVNKVGGPSYIKSIKGKNITVRGLVLNDPIFGWKIMISEKSMILKLQ